MIIKQLYILQSASNFYYTKFKHKGITLIVRVQSHFENFNPRSIFKNLNLF